MLLFITTNRSAASTRTLRERKFSIGSRGCDVLIDDPLIAPRHLEIVVRATDFVVTPLADTSIDGALITGPTPCRSGQLIGIGDSVLHLEPDRPGDPVALQAV